MTTLTRCAACGSPILPGQPQTSHIRTPQHAIRSQCIGKDQDQ